MDKSSDGTDVVALSKRQGTEKLSATALSSAVMAETYYIAGAQYIVATATKVYYLNGSFVPVEIGDVTDVPTFTEFKGKLIIHDTGTTKAWDGTTLENLNCLYSNEIIETGDGATVIFTGTLAHLTVKPASLTITYTDGTLKTITSTAGGALEGDIAAGTNTINYTTGAYNFTCSGAPDDLTSVYAEYEDVAAAPKSKAGFVRASRLYMWGDSDYPSRMWYSGPNDADAWDTSSSGGYLDVDPLDGYSLIGCANYFQSIIAVKGNKLHWVADFPGDATFLVKPLMENTGSLAYRTIVNTGDTLSFLSKEGWMALSSTDEYGDITKSTDISAKFRENAVKYATTICYAEYNQIDRQLWLTLYDGVSQWPEIYVVSLETGGQLSLYEFAFGHTSYKFVNGEMLIGGSDGHLYRLYGQRERFTDNLVSYSAKTYIRGAMTDFAAGFNRKHNKRIFPHIYGRNGTTATLNLYTDGDYTNIQYTTALTLAGGSQLIWDDRTSFIWGDSEFIYEDVVSEQSQEIDKKFDYKQLMFEITDIDGSLGVEFYGIDFFGSMLGE
ncbi:MAG TPA: hypothetical protein ACFYD4_09365 [Candidatus Wunengus sp. YC61]|uniref:hypothetical protein n=1 Tax=Candidatus Wunengus sp. YC61 TaxID=3367698 RepID=UPI00402A1944